MGGRTFRSPGETKNMQGISISFNDSTNTQGVNISLNNSGMFIQSPYEMVVVNMHDQSQEILQANTLYPFKLKTLYSSMITVYCYQFLPFC